MILPHRSDEDHPVLKFQGGRVELSYEYEDGETAMMHQDTMTFESVVLLTVTERHSCSVEQIHAYDKIVELMRSPLLDADQGDQYKSSGQRRHFRVFLGGSDCYDIVAADLSVSWDIE